MKVVDVTEMNYLSTDRNASGEPTPRGEVCLKGNTIFTGYYKSEEKTKEAIDSDGWLHTGDIGMILPNGSLKIIDRKKNIFKLAIGEYIAAEKIENIYSRCRYVLESFVYGDSLQHYLVGIFFVVNEAHILELAKANNIVGTIDEVLDKPELIKKFLEEINKKGKEEKLQSFELVKKAKLQKDSFGVQDLLTPTAKLKRFNAKKAYETHINRLYEEGKKDGL